MSKTIAPVVPSAPSRARFWVRLVILAVCVATLACWLRPVPSTLPFRPRRFLPPKPPIVSFVIATADESRRLLAEEELVVGVVISGQARAYPLNMLSGPDREIINDTLAEVPLAVTWCDWCHSANVFDRRADQQTLVFSVAGTMWQRNLVMLDQQTQSQWSQMLGRAESGPLLGTILNSIDANLESWADWRARFPQTTVLLMPRTAQVYQNDFYPKHTDHRFVFVLGQKAWSWEYLRQAGLARDEINGQPVVVVWLSEIQTARAYSTVIAEKNLRLEVSGNDLHDPESLSVWDARTGLGLRGPLANHPLKVLPGLPRYRDEWLRFHPRAIVRESP